MAKHPGEEKRLLGYASWDSFTRFESEPKNAAREVVSQVVIGHALKSHFCKVVYDDPTVASLRHMSHDYPMGETPTKFNFDVLILLAALTWVAAIGRSKHGFTREVIGTSVSFAVDEFLDANWVGSPYLERAAERLNGDVADYTDDAFRLTGSQFEVNRENLVQQAATKLVGQQDSRLKPAIERLVGEQLAALDDLFGRYDVVAER